MGSIPLGLARWECREGGGLLSLLGSRNCPPLCSRLLCQQPFMNQCGMARDHRQNAWTAPTREQSGAGRGAWGSPFAYGVPGEGSSPGQPHQGQVPVVLGPLGMSETPSDVGGGGGRGREGVMSPTPGRAGQCTGLGAQLRATKHHQVPEPPSPGCARGGAQPLLLFFSVGKMKSWEGQRWL